MNRSVHAKTNALKGIGGAVKMVNHWNQLLRAP